MTAKSTEKRLWSRVFLVLGSNLGNRKEYLAQAREQIGENSSIHTLQKTIEYSSPALLFERQPDFLNQIILAKTTYDPWELLNFLKRVEKLVGRRERFRYGPREIDIDILSYENYQIQDEYLILPHPGLKNRSYIRHLLSEMGETPELLSKGLTPYAKRETANTP